MIVFFSESFFLTLVQNSNDSFSFLDEFVMCFLILQISQLLPLQKKFTELNNQLKLKEYELELFKGRAEQNEHHKVVLLMTISLVIEFRVFFFQLLAVYR